MTKYRIVELNSGAFVLQREKFVGDWRRSRGELQWGAHSTYTTEQDARDRKTHLESQEQGDNARIEAAIHAGKIKRIVE